MDYKSLIDCIRKEEITLFIGSGFSLKAGAPSAYELVTAIKAALNPGEEIRGDNLDLVSEEYQQMYGRESLMNIIRKKMLFTPTDTSDHQCLTRIPHIHNIITTNYDTLLEDAYGEDNAFVIRNSQDCTRLSKDKVNIFKIHGDFQSTENILLTKQDYTDFFTNNKEPLLWNYIQTEILTRDILFIGYSLEDSNIFEIMKKIKNAVNGETRRFFLIAPGLPDHKIRRLAEANVTYYNAKAEDFFPELFLSLDKHVKSDYNRKRISFTTLSKYSNQHDLEAIGKEGGNCNAVEFKPKGVGEFKINFSANKTWTEKLISGDYENISNSLVPRLTIPVTELKNFGITMNGMTIGTKSDLSYLNLSPTSEEISATLKIKEIGFNEKIVFTRYTIKNQHTFKSKLDPYTIQFVFTMNQSNKTLDCTCGITLNEKYTNNSEGLKWIEFAIASWENKEIIISLFPTLPLRFPTKLLGYGEVFRQVKQYYQNMKQIELLYDTVFEEYWNYTPERLETSNLLINAYHECFIPAPQKGNECLFEIDGNAEKIMSEIILQKKGYCFTLPYIDTESIEFNGKNFTLKPKHLLMANCKVLSVTKSAKEKVRLRVKMKENSLYHFYTEKDFKEINELKDFKLLGSQS